MRRVLVALIALLLVPASALGAGFAFPTVSADLAVKPKVGPARSPAPTALKRKDVVVGAGAVARAGSTVSVQYVGRLYRSGKQFDASWDRGQPFSFTVATGSVIPGFERGVKGMRVGGRRAIVIPPGLGYGRAGAPPAIPGGATLLFVVDLVGVS